MKLQSPIIIGSRLLPAIRVVDATVSIGYAEARTNDNRLAFRWHVDIGESIEGRNRAKHFTGADVNSGVGVMPSGAALQDGLCALLSFLSACGEAVNAGDSATDPDSNASLFPIGLGRWCAANYDELSLASYELEEAEGLITD